MFKKLVTAAAVTAALACPVAASAALITNEDGTFSFTGFDWSQSGTAYTTGFVPTGGDLFTLTYFSNAIALQDGIFNVLGLTTLDTQANGIDQGYEYTIVATVQEQVISCVGTTCTFAILGGTFNVYYDITADANQLAGSFGTGYTDGIAIISGTINPLASSTFDQTSGSNSTTVTGVVTDTDLTYINPALAGTTATTTLQIGSGITNNYVSPGGFNGTAFPSGTLVFQADGNQSFTPAVVPEPGALALVALGLLGLGGIRRRK